MRSEQNITTGEVFARNLSFHRQRLGWTQAELAEKINATPGHIGHLERQEREPSFALIDRLCRAIGISVVELIGHRASNDDAKAPRLELDALLDGRPPDEVQLVVDLARVALQRSSRTAPTRRSRRTRR